MRRYDQAVSLEYKIKEGLLRFRPPSKESNSSELHLQFTTEFDEQHVFRTGEVPVEVSQGKKK